MQKEKRLLNRASIELFIISFLVLYLELLIIRWLSTEIRYFAYFKNFPLIAAFSGLGIGCALTKRKANLFSFFPFLITVFTLAVLYFGRNLNYLFVNISFEENAIWTMPKAGDLTQIVLFYLFFLSFFFFNMLIFVCLGQLLGRLMVLFKPLVAYSINIFGSLIGILFFSLISFLSLAPIFWFSFAFVLSLVFAKNNRRLFIASLFLFLIVLGVIKNIHSKEKAI